MNEKLTLLLTQLSSVIFGKERECRLAVCALLAGGDLLIEDVPGVGKTRLVSALAKSVEGRFNRIQLTPDIMPSDIVGFSMINPDTRELEYKQGAAVCNFMLADEINRASPKSQSSLLEVMEEHQISLDGRTFDLPVPFMVLATQNPVETYGTYHLPEAQMDRFLMKISMGYPTFEEELEIIDRAEEGREQVASIDAVMTVGDVRDMIAEASKVRAVPAVKKYIIDLVSATRNSDYVKLGVSPRGSIALLKASKAYAYVKGRDYVVPDDVKDIMTDVLAHRLMLSPKGKSAFESNEDALRQIALTVTAPADGGN